MNYFVPKRFLLQKFKILKASVVFFYRAEIKDNDLLNGIIREAVQLFQARAIQHASFYNFVLGAQYVYLHNIPPFWA